MSTALPPKPRIVTPKKKIAVVASTYNEEFTNALVDHTINELTLLSPLSQIQLVRVSGAYEIPVTIKAMLEKDSPDCVIALGVIIKGATSHADLVAGSVTTALQQLALEFTTPIIHEVLLLNDEQQARERCLGPKLNRGIEAARSAFTILDVFNELIRPVTKSRINSTRHGNA